MDKSGKLAACQSTNDAVPKQQPGPAQDCGDVVNINVFFDGTGNNLDADEHDNKWANPARLWKATQLSMDEYSSDYSIYVSGVGTEYNGKDATGWIDKKWKSVQDGLPGSASGAGGDRRIDYGEAQVNAAMRRALEQSVKKLDISMAAYDEKGKPQNMRELSRALENHGRITVINLAVFGFSRGAALARAFTNEMVRQCKRGSKNELRYKGVPIQFKFLGLFDTVASFGLPRCNIDGAFDEKNLVVSHEVIKCVHYIAAHELRWSFPVDSIRKNGVLKPGWIEKIYPGVHSDVGGGYRPHEQGIDNNYARIPMYDMWEEAVEAGVKMPWYAEMPQLAGKLFKKWYDINWETTKAYNAYMEAVNPPEAPQEAVEAHMKALYASWGTMTRRKIQTPDLVERATWPEDKKDSGHPGIAWEANKHLQAASKKYERDFTNVANWPTTDWDFPAVNFHGGVYGARVRSAKWRLRAWLSTAPDPVLNFIRHSVHDSKAGFKNAMEPFSYFTARGMAESSRNVLARGLDWMDDVATAGVNGVIRVYHTTEGIVVQTYKDGVLLATRTYKVGEKFVVDTVQAGVKYTVQVYQSGKEIVIDKAQKGQQMIIMSYRKAASTASAIGTEIHDGAIEAGHKVADGAAAARDYVSESASAAGRKLSDGASAAGKYVSDNATAAGQKLSDGASAVGKYVSDSASSAAQKAGSMADEGVKTIESAWQTFSRRVGL